MASAIPLPAALGALDGQAQPIETPCGRGTMRWRVWGEGGREKGPPLLLLHGGSGSWMHWARTIPDFARDRTVIAPDMPGLGQSSRPHEPDRLLSYADAIAAGLKSMIGPTAAVDLVAFSFGSIVAGALLTVPGVRIRKLVLVGPSALGVATLDRRLVPVRHLGGDARRAANRENLAILMFADPARIDSVAVDIQEWNTRHTRTDSPPFARTTSLRDALAASGRTFAAISGEHDAPSQPARTTPVLRAVCPDAAIRVLPGIGHWCMYEAADLFNATLREVLATLPAGELP